MKKYFLVLAVSLFTVGFSQNYKPADTTYSPVRLKTFQGFLETSNENLGNDLKALNLQNKRTVSDITSNRKKMFAEMLKEKTFFFDESTEKYIQGLMDQIVQKNNLKITPQKVLLSRETNPNALSLGDGLYIFNTSIVNKMDSEDEISYILSHELSHYILKHLQRSLVKNDQLKNSADFKARVKEVRKTRNSGIQKGLSLLKDYQYFDKKNSRKQEIEADSLAFILFKNVAKDPGNAAVALSKLDSVSPIEIANLQKDDYRRFFDTPSQKFKEEWLEIYGENTYNYSKSKVNSLGINSDSISTHPEITERIALLRKKSGSGNSQSTSIITPEFQAFKNKMMNETLFSYFVQKEYGRGLYFALQTQKKDPENEFARKMRGFFLENLADARKKHTYKRYVDDVNVQKQSDSYTRFLAILENLSTSELEKLAQYYKNN
ncbi:MAG: M48 family metalloprotease [Kaistella sp.]|nr:M48 family metalloprotease [Kaistella sp.]